MVISSFNKKIVFVVQEAFLEKAATAIAVWAGKHLQQNAGSIRAQFPLKPATAFAFDSSWSKPLGPFIENWSTDENSIYLNVESDEEVDLLVSLLHLNYVGSYPQYNYEKAMALKEQLMSSGVTAINKKV